MKKSVSSTYLYQLAWLALVLDRILFFFPTISVSGPRGVPMSLSFDGMLYMFAFPILAFLLVEKCVQSTSFEKDAKCLLFLAVLLEIPFDLLFNHKIFDISLNNLFFTLFLGEIALIIQKKPWNSILRLIAIAGVGVISCITNCDFGIGGILLILLLYYSRSIAYKRLIQMVGMLLIAWLSRTLALRGWMTMYSPGIIYISEGHFLYAQYLYVLALIPISLFNTDSKPNSEKTVHILYESLPLIYLAVYAIRYCVKGF